MLYNIVYSLFFVFSSHHNSPTCLLIVPSFSPKVSYSKAAPPKAHWLDTISPFLIGGLSGMTATSVIQPIDTVKVRIQIKGEEGHKNVSPFAVAREIHQQQGVKGFYQGLDSALFRQATYATARLGIYKSISDHLKAKNKSTA